MKRPLTILAALALGACTATPEMIAAQKDRCTAVGHAPGSTDHALCTERGTAQQQATQNAVTGAVVAGAVNAAIWNAIW